MHRPLLLAALVWASFLIILPFAAAGDTSYLHIGSHLIQLALLGVASVIAWRFRGTATATGPRVMGALLALSVPAAFVCILAELVVAVMRLGHDGWVNRDTADVWEEGPHFAISAVTIPAVMISMAVSAVLVIAVAVQARRRREPTT